MEASNPERGDLSDLIQGTLTKDADYEKSIEEDTELQHYMKEVFEVCRGQNMKKKGQTTDQSEIKHATRFYGLLFQWIKVRHGKYCKQKNPNLKKTLIFSTPFFCQENFVMQIFHV